MAYSGENVKKQRGHSLEVVVPLRHTEMRQKALMVEGDSASLPVEGDRAVAAVELLPLLAWLLFCNRLPAGIAL